MKVGDKLIAIDECRMISDNRKTLTIGKEYSVKQLVKRGFSIIDDEGSPHEFDNHDYTEFFKLKYNDTIVESVISQFKERSEVGINKYGVTLDRNDLTTLEWIEHAKQEAMDFVLYLEKLKQQLS